MGKHCFAEGFAYFILKIFRQNCRSYFGEYINESEFSDKLLDEVLLADADVLIDYAKSDRSILTLVTENFANVYVLQEVLSTVKEIGERDCGRLGIHIIESDIADLVEAGAQSGPLSFEDWLCMITCRKRTWTCVSNDRALIRECRKNNIKVRRGLNLMVELVKSGFLDRRRALRIAQLIHDENPTHINNRVLKLFEEKLRKL